MFRKESYDIPETPAFCENDQGFYERINEELSNMKTELRKCENDLGVTCGKLYIFESFAESILKEYAKSQIIFGPIVLECAMKLSNFVEETKRKHLT